LTLARPLRFVLAPSRGLATAIAGVHALAALSLWASLPGPWGALAGVFVAVLGVVTARDRGLLRGRNSVRAIEIAGPEDVALELADGSRDAVRLLRRKHVSRLGVGLGFEGRGRRSFYVAADMLEPEAFRRLRLWALWGRVAASGDRWLLGSGAARREN
jgi:hypothetical protein